MAEEASQSTQDGAQNPSNTNTSSGAANSDGPPKWFQDWEAKQEAAKQQPQTPTPQQNPQGDGNGGKTIGQELMSRLDALPEQIAKFINEANPKPPQAQSNSDGNSGEPPKTPGTPQGKTRQQRFADWWVNG